MKDFYIFKLWRILPVLYPKNVSGVSHSNGMLNLTGNRVAAELHVGEVR